MGYPIYASTGLTHHDKSKAFEGVTIYTPLGSGDTYVIDMQGEVVHTWTAPVPEFSILCVGRRLESVIAELRAGKPENRAIAPAQLEEVAT